MGTMKQFINQHKITAESVMVEENPNMDSMPTGSYYWRVTLRKAPPSARRMTIYYSMGPALDHEPRADEVLDCLASDASGCENAQSFEDWCRGYGYDTDSRKAEKTYQIIENQARRLKAFCATDETYKDLLWNTERL